MSDNLLNSNVVKVELSDEMQKSYLDYSMSVIVRRALPDVRDGLKPVHRRILYTMYENGLFPDKGYRKCADTVGSVLGRYHPHGDASVYDALVRMAQDFSLRYMLVDGHGNFGSIDGYPAAAYRYTEARISKIAVDMLRDIEKETVDFATNYDDRLKEPTVLPSRFPNLLVNGSSGIAVGMATNIPPHNLNEVISAMCAVIDNPEIEIAELCEHIKGPDFPTGGTIMGYAGIRAAYKTGRGRIIVRAKCEIEEIDGGKYRIIVSEIPYAVNKQHLVKSMVDLVNEKRIEGIDDIVDYSNREGIRIVVELKKSAQPQVILSQLYSMTQLQTTFGTIMLALVGGQPKILNLKEMLQHYIDHQCEIVTRRCQYELRKAEERAHILRGLKIALDHIDEIIKLIRASENVSVAKTGLMERFGLDDIQATAIVQMRLGQLTGLEREKIEAELAELEAKIKELNEILANPGKILAIVREEALKLVDRYADERRTEISPVFGEVDIEDLIPQEEVVLTLTKMGYVKRLAASTYKAQKRGGRGVSGQTLRDEDYAEFMFSSSSHDYVLFFTNNGTVYRLKAYEIPEGSRASKGLNIVNLLPLGEGEKVTAMIKVTDFEEDLCLSMVTRMGTIKRMNLSELHRVNKNGKRAITIDEGDELRWVELTDGTKNLLVGTKNGMAVKFKEEDLRVLSRLARGVRAIRMADEDEVVGMSAVDDETMILTVADTGLGRRSIASEYRLTKRGGKGVTNYKLINGTVAAICAVEADDDIIMISDDGVIIRMASETIRECARVAKGVRVMRLAEGSKIVTVSVVKREEEVVEVAEGENSASDVVAENSTEE